MDSIRGRDDDTPQPEAPTPPDITSKSTNISQSKVNLTDSGLHRASSRPTLQGRPSYATIARDAPPSERLDGAAGANPATASGQPSRRREPLPTDKQTTAISGTTLRGRQAITERRDASQFDNEFDGRSRAGQVSPRINVVLPLAILTSGPQLQPPPDADNTQSASVYPTSSPKLPNISASKEARAAQLGGVTSPGPIASAGSMQLSSQLHPVTNSPPSRNVLPSRTLQDTGSNVSLGAPGLKETRERNESPPFAQVDPPRERTVIRSHAEQLDSTASVQPSVKPFTSSPSAFSSRDRNAIRPHAEQVDRTASIRQSVKPSTPPLPLKRPSASTSPLPLPSPPAPALVKKASSRMQTPRGTPPYDPQAPSRGTHFDSPHPLGEDGGKARSDEQGRMNPSTPHRPPAPPEHIPATTEPPSRQELNSSSVPRRPVPLEHNYAMTELPSRQDRKDTSTAQHRPPASSEQTPAATEPFRKGIKDAPHRLPTPREPATIELPSRQDRKDPSTVQHGPPVPSEHTLAMTEPLQKGHKDASDTPHSPPTPPEHAPATTEPLYRLKRSPSSVPHVPPEHTHAMPELPSRWDRKDPSAVQRESPALSEHALAATEHPRKGHKDTSHRPPTPPEDAPATAEPPSWQERNPPSIPHKPSVLSERTNVMTELPSWQDRKDFSAAQHGPPAPSEHTPATAELLSRQDRKGPSAVPYSLPVPTEHNPATIDPPTQPQQITGPRRLDRSNSRIQGKQGVNLGAEQAVEGPLSEKKERIVLVSKERENRQEDSTHAEPNPTTSNLKLPKESSVQRTRSSRGREYDSSASHVHDTNDSRGKMGQSSNSAPVTDQFDQVKLSPPLTDQRGEGLRVQPTSLDDRHFRSWTASRRTTASTWPTKRQWGLLHGFLVRYRCGAALPVLVAAASFNPLGDA
jgi:hypothetical protein